MSKDGKTKDIFFGIVAIATLIVAIIGATLAYFSITASSNEGAVNATAATVSINYNDGQQVTAQAKNLIPATPEVVKKVYEKLKDIIVEQLGVNEEQVKLESTFVDDLGADSLDTVELLMAFEEEFGCSIPDDAAEKIRTVKDAVDFIAKQV